MVFSTTPAALRQALVQGSCWDACQGHRHEGGQELMTHTLLQARSAGIAFTSIKARLGAVRHDLTVLRCHETCQPNYLAIRLTEVLTS